MRMTALTKRVECRYAKSVIMAMGLCVALILSDVAIFTAFSLGVENAGKAVESSGETESGEDIAFKEEATLLLKIPEEGFVVADSVRPRPREGVVGLVYQSGPDRFKPCVNSVCGPYIQKVAKEMPVISPDGRHWAAIVSDGRKAHVMLNGKMSQGYDMVHHVIFSPDSMKLSFIARTDREFTVHLNQEVYGPFPLVDPEGLRFSSDSRYLVYGAQTGKKTWSVMINGKSGPEYDKVKHVAISPDSGRIAYAAKIDGQWRLVEENLREEKRTPEKAVIGPGAKEIMRVVFCPQSKKVAYVAGYPDGAAVINDGVKGEVFEHVVSGPLFGSDGNRLAYAVMERGPKDKMTARMVVDNTPSPPYDEIGPYYFSGKGNFVYMVQEGEKGRIVYNDEPHEAHFSVGLPVVAQKTGRLAYPFFEDGKWAVKIDGEKGPRFDWVENMTFCPNGKRFAYIAGKEGKTVYERQYMIVEGETVLGTYSWAGLTTFSPDGKHLAYAAAEHGESFLVIDGQKGKERFLSFVKGSPLVFTADNIVEGLAVRDAVKEFYHIRAEFAPDRGLASGMTRAGDPGGVRN